MTDSQTGRKREAFADELTDGQIKFMYYADQERERMKKKAMEREQRKSNF